MSKIINPSVWVRISSEGQGRKTKIEIRKGEEWVDIAHAVRSIKWEMTGVKLASVTLELLPADVELHGILHESAGVARKDDLRVYQESEISASDTVKAAHAQAVKLEGFSL